MLRWNPHFHAIVLEGGFDEEGTFFYIPFSGLQWMVGVLRRRVIKLLVERELLNGDFARNLLSWKHSGFSIDNSVRILEESLAEYIARPPISLGKIRYEPFKGRVLFQTTYSEYFKENLHMQVACPGRSRRLRPGFDALDFIAELTPDAWASNTTTKEWYDQPSISLQNDSANSPLRFVCVPDERTVGGNALSCRA